MLARLPFANRVNRRGRTVTRSLVAFAVFCLVVSMLGLGVPARAATAQYVVVIDQSATTAAYAAIASAGGSVVSTNALGIVTVMSASSTFALALRASPAVVGVALNAGFAQAAATTVAAPANTHTQAAEGAACATLYSSRRTSGRTRLRRANGTCAPSARLRPARTP